MLDMISVGDATLDNFLGITDANVKCSVNKESCEICFSYADKIPVDTFEQSIAGNALNNAVGSDRLGLKTAIYTEIGQDDTGEAIMKHLKEEGVSTRFVRYIKGEGTNYSTVLNYDGERTILVYHYPRKYRFPKLPKSAWLYYTSMAKTFIRVQPEILRHVKKHKIKMGFNPGTFQLLAGTKKLKPALRLTEVLFVNKAEAKLLTEDETTDMKQLLRKAYDLGPNVAVITDGKKGSYAFDGNAMYHMPIFPIPRVEATGVGDSFATGFIAALAQGKEIPEAMRWGTANAGSVVSYVGPQKGLLTKGKMYRLLKKHQDIKPKTTWKRHNASS